MKLNGCKYLIHMYTHSMQHNHSHDGHAHHHHHSGHNATDAKLTLAVWINVGLTFVQIIGGIFAGSLALIADALHNFSDAAALLLAIVARRIARRKADDKRTYGYQRVETIAALINLTALVLIGFWLAVEAFIRFFDPQPVQGWPLIIVAGVALCVDVGTALLTWKEAKTSHNIRAAFLHNVADALSSVGVIIGGILILVYGWTILDPIITLAISIYVMAHAAQEFRGVIHLLLDGVPDGISPQDIAEQIQLLPNVMGCHHIHVRHLNEQQNALEAHVVISSWNEAETVKDSIKKLLLDEYNIPHCTLEFEINDCGKGCE